MGVRELSFALKTASVFRSSMLVHRDLAAHDRLSADALQALNDKLMLDQVRFAMSHTDFYRDHYREAGIELGDVTDPDVLRSLPPVTKEQVRERHDAFISDEATDANSRRVATGGSTGEPLVMKRDTRANPRAYEWRLQGWWGVPPWSDTGIVYRFFRSPRETLKQQAVWWPSRRFQLDAFAMTPAAMSGFLDTYDRVQPGFLIGYVGGVLELARFAAQQHRRVVGSPVIATTAAPVTWSQREEIEAVFGGRVYDHYRCAELNWIAGECRHRSGLHVFDDLKRVEVLGEDGTETTAGVSGELVVTDFTNRVFPLIRYRTGDISARIEGPCGCGMHYSRIENVRGRVTEAALLPSGEVIAGEALAQTFSKVAEAVRQFQVHQHEDMSITLRVIPKGRADDPRIGAAVQAVRSVVSDQVPVRLEIVDALPHHGGKIRYVTSDALQRRGTAGVDAPTGHDT